MARPKLDDPTVPIAFRMKRSAAEIWTAAAAEEGTKVPKLLRALAEEGSAALLLNQPVVYRFYNADGVLLYVGVTNSIATRLAGHRSTKAWWAEVVSAELEMFSDRRAAEAAESRAITTEGPRYNRRPGRQPGPPKVAFKVVLTLATVAWIKEQAGEKAVGTWIAERLEAECAEEERLEQVAAKAAKRVKPMPVRHMGQEMDARHNANSLERNEVTPRFGNKIKDGKT